MDHFAGDDAFEYVKVCFCVYTVFVCVFFVDVYTLKYVDCFQFVTFILIAY